MDLTVSVLVTNYNTASLTARCLDSVNRFRGSRPVEVVVVDDASTEPLPPREGVVFVRNERNQGYVRSVNIGVARTHHDVVLLLDSDAELLSDVFTPMVAAFGERPELGAIGFHLVDRSDRPTGATAPEPSVLGLAVGQALEQRLQRMATRSSSPDYTIHSCALAFRRSAFDALGGFDEGFDFLDADTDFSMRLRRSGWQLDVLREAKILHEGSGSPQTTARRVLRHHANRWRLLEKHGFVRHPTLLKTVLATRHAAELLWLEGPSRLLQKDPDVRADKVAGRRRLFKDVWHAYRSV